METPHPHKNSDGLSGSRGPRLQSIDALRGFAMLIVLMGHIPRISHPPELTLHFAFAQLPLAFGYTGVHLFIVLSGFCIHRSVLKMLGPANDFRTDWKVFWLRRFWRLYPPYVAAIGFSLAIYYGTHEAFVRPWEKISSLGWDLVTHLFMVHNLFTSFRHGLGNSPFWTLGLEEQLYLLFFCYLLLRRRSSAQRTLLVALLITLAWKVVVITLGATPKNFIELDAFPMNWWFLWVLGAVVAEAERGIIKLPEWTSRRGTIWVFLMIGAISSDRIIGRVVSSHWFQSSATRAEWTDALLGLLHFSPIFLGVGYFALVNRCVSANKGTLNAKMGHAWLAKLGLISYSAYLTHLPMIRLLEWLLPLNSFWGSMAKFFLYPPICFAIAGLFFVLIERRFLLRHSEGQTLTSASGVSTDLLRAPT